MGLDTKTYWLTDRQSQCDFNFNFTTQLTELDWKLNQPREVRSGRIRGRPMNIYHMILRLMFALVQ
jgi:hypothetical protein